MVKKQVKIIKIVRAILMSIYLYFMWRVIQTNEHFIIIATIIMFCGVALGEVLPKEYKVGNTFLNNKSKQLEVTLEILTMLVLAFFLIILFG